MGVFGHIFGDLLFCQNSPLMTASYDGGVSKPSSLDLAPTASVATSVADADTVLNSEGGAEGEGWSE